MTIRILLVDDHKMLREALRLALEMEDDMRVVGEAGSGAELLSLLRNVTADVVVLDIGLPDMSGIEVAQQIGKHHQGMRVVALSGYTDKIFVDEMMKAGARGFVVKSAGADELVLAIRAASSGKIFLSPEITAGVMRHRVSPDRDGTPPLSVLGKREQEVLRMLADGKSSPEIAGDLGLSPATVDVHRRNIKRKLRLNSIAELTRYAIREGLISVK